MAASFSDADRIEFTRAAWDALDEDAIADLLVNLVDIPSPTGNEAPLASFLADHLERRGLEVSRQAFGVERANVIARLSGSGGGPELLLFSPIDTPWGGDEDEAHGFPLEDRPDFRPEARRVDEFIIGLGAANPKAFVASITAAAEVVAQGEFALPGSLVVGLAAGGMPVYSAPLNAKDVGGHGIGCRHMLDEVRPDLAVVTKPGYAVAYEEAGLLWYRIRVHGTMAYAGMRHLLPYLNPLVGAARIIEVLEEFFPRYSDEHTAGLISPQGTVGSIIAGWPDRPAFVPAYADILVDVRAHWNTSAEDVDRELEEQVRSVDIGEMSVTCERIVTFPGGHTDPKSWIVQSVIRGWEAVEDRPHSFRINTSGISEANLLRAQGIPTARVGMPWVEAPSRFGGFSMGVASPAAVLTLARLLCAVIIDSCSRDQEETAPTAN